MQLEHSFTIPVGIDDAWRALLDIEHVAPCLPGAALDSIDGDDFTGSLKIKIGPLSLTYKGKASLVDTDIATHRATIDAQGRDARGGGTAAAKVTAALLADGPSSTRVEVSTDLNVTGKPAQFGRGVLLDAGTKLLGQFADSFATQLSTSNGTARAAIAPAKKAPVTKAPARKATAPQSPTAKAPAKAAPARKAPQKTAATKAAAPSDGAAVATAAPSEPVVKKAPVARKAPAKKVAAAAAPPPIAAKLPETPPILAPATPAPAAEAIDLLAPSGPARAKRLAPIVAAMALGAAVVVIVRRRRQR
jgi:carbon monoxide dehydrogenase subunit G